MAAQASRRATGGGPLTSGPQAGDRLSRKEQKKRTAERVRLAAVAVLRERGFAETTVEEIARRASVAKGTVLFHLGQKERLLSLYATDRSLKAIGRARQLSTGRPERRVSAAFLSLLGTAERDSALEEALGFTVGQLLGQRDEGKEYARPWLELLPRSGPRLSAEAVAAIERALVVGWLCYRQARSRGRSIRSRALNALVGRQIEAALRGR
jgi:AcrR family transcriptional regulator